MNRRTLLATAAGASGLAIAARLADQYGLIPPDSGGLYGPGHALTYAAQRLLTSHSLAREFSRDQISDKPVANETAPPDAAFQKHQAEGFTNWRLTVDGLVTRPGAFSLAELQALPARSQITGLACEEGWSYIAEWTGVPLAAVLLSAGIRPEAKFVVYFSGHDRWRNAIDMADALHPQTVLAHGMNGGSLPFGHGGPLRMRVPRQLGYKSVKFINRITVTDTLNGYVRAGAYSWYAGI